jgi:hypothetical protein
MIWSRVILMANGYRDMAEKDKEFAELSFEAQREIVALDGETL